VFWVGVLSENGSVKISVIHFVNSNIKSQYFYNANNECFDVFKK